MYTFKRTIILVALSLGGISLWLWFAKGGQVIGSQPGVAAIIAELQNYSEELAATCIPAVAHSNLGYALSARDVMKRDALGVISSDPAEANHLCIQQFCLEVSQTHQHLGFYWLKAFVADNLT